MIRRIWLHIRPEYKPGIISPSEFAWGVVLAVTVGLANTAVVLHFLGVFYK